MSARENPRKVVHPNPIDRIRIIPFICAGMMMLLCGTAKATTYYVSSSGGNDNNAGTLSNAPWKTLAKAGQTTYAAGDSLLLKCNDTWTEQFVCKGSGSTGKHVVMASYSSGRKPRTFRQKETGSVCIYVGAVDRWTFSNLEVANAEFGIEIDSKGTSGLVGITIEKCYFHDLKLNQDFYRDNMGYGNAWWGAAIWVGYGTIFRNTHPDSITIRNCISTDCDGFYQQTENDGGFGGFIIDGCTIKRHPANTILWMRNKSGTNRLMQNCVFLDNGGQRPMPWGGCDVIWVNASNATIQDCEFGNRTFHQDAAFDGAALDLESGTCSNILIKRCDIHDCWGYALMYMESQVRPSNTSLDSCLLRYNCKMPANQSYATQIVQLTTTATGHYDGNTYYLAPGTVFMMNNSTSLTTAGNSAGTLATVATPTANKPEGPYTGSQSITLTCATTGAEIHYTLDGSYPKKTSPVYSAPITITETCALNAKAYKTGMEQSYCMSNVYVITPGATIIDPFNSRGNARMAPATFRAARNHQVYDCRGRSISADAMTGKGIQLKRIGSGLSRICIE